MTTTSQLSVHGTLVRVNQVGILLQGEAGCGKSDAALSLLYRGHQLVADDRVELNASDEILLGSASTIGQKMLFIHGLGVVNCSKLFDHNHFINECSVDLLIKLNDTPPNDYSLDQIKTTRLVGQTVAQLSLPACRQRPIAELIETAANCYLLKKNGYNAAKQFDQQLRDSMGLD